MMKIATWNTERLTKANKHFAIIIDKLQKVDADILILTETNEEIDLGNHYNVSHTSKPTENFYTEKETRVSIFSKYPIVRQIETFRSDTSICNVLMTPFGELAVYGTIIGNFGNRHNSFKDDLEQQLLDFETISKSSSLCIAGDFNISFSDNFYFTNTGRQKLNDAFYNLSLENLTASILKNIDHIVLSKSFIKQRQVETDYWNESKTLSDHLGVCVKLLS